MSNAKIYQVNIYDCYEEPLIVRANNKKEACKKCYDYINKLYPAKSLKAEGCDPYYLKDFTAIDITNKIDEPYHPL